MEDTWINQRIKDLNDNIVQDQQLLKAFEDALRFASNPRIEAQYQVEIQRQRDSIANYKREYIALLRQALVNFYDTDEQNIIRSSIQPLDLSQLHLVKTLLDAVEANQISELEIQRMLTPLEDRISTLPPSQASIAEIIRDPQLDARHKIKITLPIIPFLVDYEGELELGTGFDVKLVWEQLITRLWRK